MAESRRLDQLRRQVSLNPASIAFAALAEEYHRAGLYEEAIATCRTGLGRHPAYLSPRVTLGRALLALGRNEEARIELETVLRAAPDTVAAIQAIETIQVRSGAVGMPAPHAGELSGRAGASSTRDDPALPALEAFLEAILQARVTEQGRRSPVPPTRWGGLSRA